jgi:hypothetical protein
MVTPIGTGIVHSTTTPTNHEGQPNAKAISRLA